jgi:hypothetical protein
MSVPNPNDWRNDLHKLSLLPVGLEYAENVENTTRLIDHDGKGSNRFSGVDFFKECYSTLSGREKIWYAILYSAEHQLDGEILLTFRIATQAEHSVIRKFANRFTMDDWNSIGMALGVNGSLARQRVLGVFES